MKNIAALFRIDAGCRLKSFSAKLVFP